MVCLQNKTLEEVARALYVSHSTVERLVHLYNTTGDVSSIEQRHGPCRTLSEMEELTVLQLFNKPGIYLKAVQEELFSVSGKWVNCSTICRTAQRLGLTRQKMKKLAIQQSDTLRAQYMAEIEAFDPNMLVFIDETGCDKRNSKCLFGYGIRGITPITHHLLGGGKRISAIGVMSTRGLEDVYLVEGSVNGDTFLHFIQRSLLNIIKPFDGNNPRSVVILDNASIHHDM